MNGDYLDIKDTIKPPYGEWSEILSANLSMLEGVNQLARQEIRSEVFVKAQRYTAELVIRALKSGIQIAPIPNDDRPDSAVIMTGHQPIIYHSGLLIKEQLLVQAADNLSAIPVNVIIDTDAGDAGKVTWPVIRNGELAIQQGSLVRGEGALFIEQQVAAKPQLIELFSRIRDDLREAKLDKAARSVEQVEKLYLALAGEPISVANSIVRRSITGHLPLEIPLSVISALPAVQRWLLAIVKDGARCAATYNQTLDAYRLSHKIKNGANPFPNMKIEGDTIELPLWRINRAGRYPIVLKGGEPFELANGETLAPRGGIVTLLLRGYCSELFIHGLGGARYDLFVDEFALRYLRDSLPRFVVASRTRHLFPEKVEEISQALELKQHFKEIVSHTEKFLGQGLFSSEEEQGLLFRISERRELLGVLHAASSDAERSVAAKQLNELNKGVKATLEQSSLYRRVHNHGVDERSLQLWSYREFPYFFWS